MKRFIVLIFLAIFALAGNVWARSEPDTTLKVMDADYICRGGASVWVLDLTKPQFIDAEAFSLQFSGTTHRWQFSPASETTMQVYACSTNIYPWANSGDEDFASSVTLQKLVNSGATYTIYDWQPVVTNLPVLTGNTTDQYCFKVKPARFLMLKMDNSGLTDYFAHLTLGFHRGTGWVDSYHNHITSTYSQFGTTAGVTIPYHMFSGTSSASTAGYDSNQIPPDGANWVCIQPVDDDIYLTFNEFTTTPTTALGMQIADESERCIPCLQWKKAAWVTGLNAAGSVGFDWYIDKPY